MEWWCLSKQSLGTPDYAIRATQKGVAQSPLARKGQDDSTGKDAENPQDGTAPKRGALTKEKKGAGNGT